MHKQYQSIIDTLSGRPFDAKSKIVSYLLELCQGHGCCSTMESKAENWLNNKYYHFSFCATEEDLIDYTSVDA